MNKSERKAAIAARSYEGNLINSHQNDSLRRAAVLLEECRKFRSERFLIRPRPLNYYPPCERHAYAIFDLQYIRQVTCNPLPA